MTNTIWDRIAPELTEKQLSNCKRILRHLKNKGDSSVCPGWGCKTCEQWFPKTRQGEWCPCYNPQYKTRYLIDILTKIIREQKRWTN
jgi:hypothetical protein